MQKYGHCQEGLRSQPVLLVGRHKPARSLSDHTTKHFTICCRSELLQKVHATNRQLQDNMQTQQTRRIGRRDRSNSTDQVPDQIRDSNIELITIILEALEKEHEYL